MDDQYRRYFDAMPGFVTVQDRDFRIIDANQRFQNDFGQFDGRHCYQLYKQQPEKCETCPVDKTFRTGESSSHESVIQNLSGKQISVIVYTTPIFDEAGEVIAVMKMSTDITEIKLLEKQLRDSQQRYRLLFEEVPCFISTQNRDMQIIEANRNFREAFGSFLGCKCYEIYKHRNEVCLDCPVQRTFEDGQVHTSEEVVTSVTGEQLNTLVFSAPIRDASGNIRSVMEMSANITPIRRLQSQLESIGMLISSVSHGIKGLLTGLDGGIYLVNSGIQKDNRKRIEQGWEMVLRNVDRIRSTVLNILYYAKEREPNWETVSSSNLIDEVLNLVAPKAKEHNIQLEHGSDDAAGEFDGDPQAIRALLINLMENSLDACRVDKKKDEHKVILSANGSSDEVRFKVSDNGIGMDRETREKVFSLFFSSKGMEGTGLGLFIANKIAQAHSGRIEVESEQNRGTEFVVRIPRKRKENLAAEPGANLAQTG